MEEASGTRLVQFLSSAMWRIGRPAGEQETLELIVRGAVDAITDAEHAGISLLRSDGSITSYAPSSEEVCRVDQLQATLREGPCVTALWDEHTVSVEDMETETVRWPHFAPEAVTSGVASMLSFQLFVDRGSLGALNLYSGVRSGFSAEARTLAGLFAAHAATALAGAQQVSQLQQALNSRDVIGQAKGILMERFDLGAEEAFSRLVSSSQETNVKLVDVARWLTGTPVE